VKNDESDQNSKNIKPLFELGHKLLFHGSLDKIRDMLGIRPLILIP
jgi:hypothetical protein